MGAVGENDNAGAIYMFERNSSGIWNQTIHVPFFNTNHPAMFGNLIDIDVDVLVVGTTYDQDVWTGSAYIYYHIEITWVQM